MFSRFVKAWQESSVFFEVWSQFYWLTSEQINAYQLSINEELEGRGIAPLNPLLPPDLEKPVFLDVIDDLVLMGILQRKTPKDLVELEEYDAVAAMWNAQPTDYNPLDLQHISVGESGSLRFRVKR